MRKFSSYGPVNKKRHYYVPRKELLAKAITYLKGDYPEDGGHYFTVWAPRQTGKSSLLIDIYQLLRDDESYLVSYISIQHLKDIDNSVDCLNAIIDSINEQSELQLPRVQSVMDFQQVFSDRYLPKPLILIIDEFDALREKVINDIVSVFRNIYHIRIADNAPSSRKKYLLHGVALIGVRSLVGVENKSGSPFNVQKSLQVRNLTEAEVNEMYQWYKKESGQAVEQEVIDRIYHVTRGQPGLVSWFGELLTSEYNEHPDRPLTMKEWNRVYRKALHVLPNNNIINIVSKATAEESRKFVLNMFRIDNKEVFEFENPRTGYLYMHGVISYEETEQFAYIRFSSPFVQEKLYRHFAGLISRMDNDTLTCPFTDLTPVINDQKINISKLLELYQDYYRENKARLVEYAQRRADLEITEVVYHFQLFSWLDSFLRGFGTVVLPEFPTGNGKIDLLIHHQGNLYGLELKSFSQLHLLNKGIQQASEYGKSLGLAEITLIVFTERTVPAEVKEKYAQPRVFAHSATVNIFFMETG